jgi:hypothetical protein
MRFDAPPSALLRQPAVDESIPVAAAVEVKNVRRFMQESTASRHIYPKIGIQVGWSAAV